ncbi:hypothetical protein RS130_19610 [Paraglaciecola aquimarina]|uniref:Secreted protein n=1 Tax=Paraglaciecola aquimarina TaxID=1235557 RepID=A0ABU3T0M0_9ALTE|nr:hypothetical protein [Paraglaciecola aquimarina]MDU0355798.1 hypothetical protein [Paraglaciecola aquimarina]
MKIVYMGLICLLVPVVSMAQLPNTSRIFKDDDGEYKRYEAATVDGTGNVSGLGLDESCSASPCAEVSSEIPEGFGGFSLGAFNGGTEVQLTLIRYNIHYSKNGRIPFYIMATTPVAGQVDVDSSVSSLLGADSGLLNFKIADDVKTLFSESGNGDGLCDFNGASDNNLRVGVTLIPRWASN